MLRSATDMFCLCVSFLTKIHKGFDKKEDSSDSADIARQGFYHFAEVPKKSGSDFSHVFQVVYIFCGIFLKNLEHLQKIPTMPG